MDSAVTYGLEPATDFFLDRVLFEMIRFLILCFVSACFCSLNAQETDPTPINAARGFRRDIIPNTISEEAQEFLRNAEPPPPSDPQTMEQWAQWQEEMDSSLLANEVNQKALAEMIKHEEVKQYGGIDVVVVTPTSFNEKNSKKILLAIHGGGYVMMSARGTLASYVPLAHRLGVKLYSIDYRLAPQHPFPDGLNDCLAAYREIIKEYKPENIGLAGLSAGGSMSLAMLLQAKKDKLRMPAALAAMSPWSDLSSDGDSYKTLVGFSPVLSDYPSLKSAVKAYAGDHDLKNQLLSPVHGEYDANFPPTIIQTGTRDLFLSNCVRLYRKMKDSGTDVELSVWEGMWHGFTVVPDVGYPEAQRGIAELAGFFKEHLKLK